MEVKTLLPFLGTEINGDLAGLTIYTRGDGRIVSYFQSPALKPPSAAQIPHRQRFRHAIRRWKLLTDEQKSDLNRCCDRLSLCMWGLNLWITLDAQKDDTLYTTLCFQSEVILPNPRRC